jgi:hypothetical protein
MSQMSEDLKSEMRKSLALLQTWRDEVRLKLHLAGMDAKAEWRKLEPQLTEVERAAEHVTEASRDALDQALKSLGKIRDSLRSDRDR